VLDLVNPVGAGRGLVGGRRQAGLNETRAVSGKPRTHTLDQHAANLGGRGIEKTPQRAGFKEGSQPSLEDCNYQCTPVEGGNQGNSYTPSALAMPRCALQRGQPAAYSHHSPGTSSGRAARGSVFPRKATCHAGERYSHGPRSPARAITRERPRLLGNQGLPRPLGPKGGAYP
jgi:hypothetical protein